MGPSWLEEGILLIRVDLTAAPDAGVNIVGCSLVAFSTHAIARRIQRGVGRDHASITRDIADCLRARLQMEAIEVPCGRWLGSTVSAQIASGEVHVFACRTFVGG